MAKMEYTNNYPDFTYFSDLFADDPVPLDAHGKKSATFLDSTGTNIEFSGTRFTYNGGDTALTGGDVNKVIFRTPSDNTFAVVSRNGDWSAEALQAALDDGGVRAMLTKLLSGDDVLNGSDRSEFISGHDGDDKLNGYGGSDNMLGGDGKDIIRGGAGPDSISGGRGNDVLIGGFGSDLFVFGHGFGKDKVTDFDASGGGSAQDYIGADFGDVVSIKQVGDDVEIDLGHGDVLTLVDTLRKHVTGGDFISFS